MSLLGYAFGCALAYTSGSFLDSMVIMREVRRRWHRTRTVILKCSMTTCVLLVLLEGVLFVGTWLSLFIAIASLPFLFIVTQFLSRGVRIVPATTATREVSELPHDRKQKRPGTKNRKPIVHTDDYSAVVDELVKRDQDKAHSERATPPRESLEMSVSMIWKYPGRIAAFSVFSGTSIMLTAVDVAYGFLAFQTIFVAAAAMFIMYVVFTYSPSRVAHSKIMGLTASIFPDKVKI